MMASTSAAPFIQETLAGSGSHSPYESRKTSHLVPTKISTILIHISTSVLPTPHTNNEKEPRMMSTISVTIFLLFFSTPSLPTCLLVRVKNLKLLVGQVAALAPRIQIVVIPVETHTHINMCASPYRSHTCRDRRTHTNMCASRS